MLQRNPSQLREIILAMKPEKPVIIDEIQKIPLLLDEIHWLIENTGTRFIIFLFDILNYYMYFYKKLNYL